MDNSYSTLAQCPEARSFAYLVSDEEHVALLGTLGKFDLLRRKDDLLAEGVAALFGLAGGEAELLGLGFHSRRFTPSQAVHWLAERGFTPLLFVLNSGRDQPGRSSSDRR